MYLLVNIVILTYQAVLVYINITTRVHWAELQFIYRWATTEYTRFAHPQCFYFIRFISNFVFVRNVFVRSPTMVLITKKAGSHMFVTLVVFYNTFLFFSVSVSNQICTKLPITLGCCHTLKNFLRRYFEYVNCFYTRIKWSDKPKAESCKAHTVSEKS